MIIKEAEHHVCPTCDTRRRTAGEEYGCDECKKPINVGAPEREYLSATVFSMLDKSRDLQFCSWRCALAGLSKVQCEHFISLPYLTYDTAQPGVRASDFFEALKARSEPQEQPSK